MAGNKKKRQSRAQRTAQNKAAQAQRQKAAPVPKKAPGLAPDAAAEDEAAQVQSGTAAPIAAPDPAAPQPEGEPADVPAENSGGMTGTEAPEEPDADSAAGGADAPEEPESKPESEAERQRVAEMTRTVQISLEQIMAAMDDAAPAPEPGDAAPEDETSPADAEAAALILPASAPPVVTAARREPSIGWRIGAAAGRGVLGITRWLLLVVFFVALIAAVGIAFLYRGATMDLIPKVTVTLGGQTVQPTAYDWSVPVVNHLFSRRYQVTVSEQPLALAETVDDIHPELVVTPQELETSFVLKDSAGQVLFDGPVASFSEFTFEKGGAYSAELTVVNHANRFDANVVEGSQTYDFTFDISLDPSVRLDSSSAFPGDIIAVVASSIPLSEEPRLICEFPNPGFVPAQNGWIAYVPIPMDAASGDYTFTVQSGTRAQTLDLTVHERTWPEKALLEEKNLNWAYIGADNTPEAVQKVLAENDETIRWRDEGFAMPFDFDAVTELDYGTVENVNEGQGTVRTSINMVWGIDRSLYGAELKAPAAGKVVLAEDLGGGWSAANGALLPNKTLVIDHGGGLKTVYYNMASIDVAAGDTVRQGQAVGTCQMTMCMGAYVGTVPVDPMTLWQGQCSAVKYY